MYLRAQTLRLALAWCFLTLALMGCQSHGAVYEADVIVYGATPAGITAAIAAHREGASVILLEPTQHVGGMLTSGLNRDESEHMARDATFGGLADQFFTQAAGRSGSSPRRRAKVWHSRVAEQVFLEMLDQAGVRVLMNQSVESVDKQGAQIFAIRTVNEAAVRGRVFIDASYEGDLLAEAGVSYVTGRESRREFDEPLAGVIYTDTPIAVSPYNSAGELLPGVMPGPPPEPGIASPHPTPYNIRLNLTTAADNRVEITRPKRYDASQYELLARCIENGTCTRVGQIIARYDMPGGKVECNNGQFSIVSISIPGAQTPWSEASYAQRKQIQQLYRDYTHGLMWFLKTDERVPQAMRDDMARFGFCKDEWIDNDHWPWQLYVREARRMRGSYVMTEHDIVNALEKDDAIGLGSHFIDSHQPTRYATPDGAFINEGRLWQQGKVFQLPYRAITPLPSECTNLLVPVCVSASHVAFCAIRVEASWMMLGEAAGIAASLALRENRSVQRIDISVLQKRIEAAGIPVELPSPQ